MTDVAFIVEGEPRPQPRPRVNRLRTGGHVYNPRSVMGWKMLVATAAAPHVPEQPLDGPLSVFLRFYMPRPKTHYRNGKFAGQLKKDMPLYHSGNIDCDNLAKAVLDVLTDIRMWHDDGQVCVLLITKPYATKQPRCEVDIWRC